MPKFGLDLTTATEQALDDLFDILAEYFDSQTVTVGSPARLLKDEIDAETDRRDKLKQSNAKLI